MQISLVVIRNRIIDTVKKNGKYKGAPMVFYSPELMEINVFQTFLTKYNRNSFICEVSRDWKAQFDSKYSLKQIASDLNKKAERQRLKERKAV